MGGVDKGLQPFRGTPMVAHVIERPAPQVREILINANRNPADYERFGHRVIADEIEGFAGPLAGFERGLAHASHDLVVTVPCDSPFLPLDLVARLHDAMERKHAEIAFARTGDQPHQGVGSRGSHHHEHGPAHSRAAASQDARALGRPAPRGGDPSHPRRRVGLHALRVIHIQRSDQSWKCVS